MRRKSIIKGKGCRTFAKTVQSMSAKEIILAMVEGLEKPYTDKVSMHTFGCIDYNNICIGCAATNTICRIYNKKPIRETKDTPYMGILDVKGVLKVDSEFLDLFENSINALRLSDTEMYNFYAEALGIAKIIKNKLNLPALSNSYTMEDLYEYRKLAELQK